MTIATREEPSSWTAGAPRKGLTLLEALVALAVLAVLIATLAPAIQSARESARPASCLNNQKQLALASLSAYNSANPDEMLSRYHVVDELDPYFGNPQREDWRASRSDVLEVWRCPSDELFEPVQGNLSYVTNGGLHFYGRDSGAAQVSRYGRVSWPDGASHTALLSERLLDPESTGVVVGGRWGDWDERYDHRRLAFFTAAVVTGHGPNALELAVAQSTDHRRTANPIFPPEKRRHGHSESNNS